MENQISKAESNNCLQNKQSEINKIITAGASFDDRVTISTTSKQLEAIKKSLAAIPAVNEARVLYFKAEIELGNYEINGDEIAKKMLQNEMELTKTLSGNAEATHSKCT